MLATPKAKNDVLRILNMQTKDFYILKNLTKGQEQRLFTYEKGKQVWWKIGV